MTTFIAQQKSRQEFVPLVAKLIDRAHIEPLHLKNDTFSLAHRHLLKRVLEMSRVTAFSSFSQIPAILHFPNMLKYYDLNVI